MPLSKSQRKRVRAALAAGGASNVVASLADLQSPEELHQFALHYNVNDGFLPIRFLIRSPLCDKGTALYAYWLFDEIVLGERLDPEPEPDEEFDAPPIIAEIEERFLSGYYTHQEIAFDPREELAWTEEEERLFVLGEFSFPGEMLEVTPGRPVEREALD